MRSCWSAGLLADGEGQSSGVEGLVKSKFPSDLEKLFEMRKMLNRGPIERVFFQDRQNPAKWLQERKVSRRSFFYFKQVSKTPVSSPRDWGLADLLTGTCWRTWTHGLQTTSDPKTNLAARRCGVLRSWRSRLPSQP